MIGLFSIVRFFENAFTFKMSGGGGGNTTSTGTTYTTNIPEYAQPYVMSMLGAGQSELFNVNDQGNISSMKAYKPYSTNVNDYFAGPSPLQQQAYGATANLQTPGQYGMATNLAGQAGYGSLGAAGQANDLMGQALGYGQAGATYGDVGSMYGAQGAQQANMTANQAARQAQMYGRQGAQAGMQGIGVGQQAMGYGAQGAGYGAQAAQAGNQYNAMATNPYAMQAYMNPYISASLQPQLNDIARQGQIQAQQAASQATASGAFGGTRSALAQNEAARNALLAQQQAISQGYNQAYNQAQQAMQYGAGLGLQGQQAGIQGAGLGITGANAGLSGLQSAMQGAGVGLSGVGQQLAAGQLGLSGAGMGLQGAQTGMQGAGVGLSGVGAGINAGQYGLQGLGQAGQAAGTLGNLGQQQLAAQQGIISAQAQMGTQQQQAEQAKINQAIQDYATAQQYPMMQLANMNALLRGLPLQNTTTQTYAPAPSMLSQIGGLGATALGAFGAAGGFKGAKQGGIMDSAATGRVKKYLGGGITSLENRQRLAEDLTPAQLNQVIQNKTIPLGIGQAIEQDNSNMAKRAQEAQAVAAAQQAAQPAPTEEQGITRANTGGLLSRGFAGGGIVAFDEGGEVPGYADGVYVVPQTSARDLYSSLRGQIEDVPNYFPGESVPGMTRQQKIRDITRAAKTPYDEAINYYKSLGYQDNPLYAESPATRLETRRQQWLQGQKDPFTGEYPVGSAYNKFGTQTTTPAAEEPDKTKPVKDVPKGGKEDKSIALEEAAKTVAETPAKEKSLADYAKELQDFLGENPEKTKAEERATKAEKRAADMEDKSIWNAIMKGGLKAMQGTSPFALQNIGLGGEAGLNDYLATKDKVEALRDKADDYRSAYLAADRREKLAEGKFGADSREAERERVAKNQLQQQHDATLIMLQKMDDKTKLQAANIAANARETPKPMTVGDRLKLKEAIDSGMIGEEKKILDSLGSNAKLPTSKAYPEYVRQMNAARQRLAADAMSGGMTGIAEPSAAAPAKSSGIKFLGWEK